MVLLTIDTASFELRAQAVRNLGCLGFALDLLMLINIRGQLI